MRKVLYLIVILLVAQSCAKRPEQRISVVPCESTLPRLFSKTWNEYHLHIRGRVRIDLPRYRVRGLCTIQSTPVGDLRLDFHHSSLFGAYREDATIYLRNGMLGILDRERGVFFENDSTISMLRDHLEFNILPDDIAHLLLLACPDCAEIDSLRIGSGKDGWRFSGLWRGRRIEVEGRDDGEPTRFRQCVNKDSSCYVVSYEYGRDMAPERYPTRITVSREYGSERLSLVVRDVKHEYAGDEIFELFDSLVR
jgi:hypothetical protein